MPKMKLTGKIVQKLWLGNTEKFMLFDADDLDFYAMTLVLKVTLDIIETYVHSRN